MKKELEQQDDMNIVPEVFMISVGGVGSLLLVHFHDNYECTGSSMFNII